MPSLCRPASFRCSTSLIEHVDENRGKPGSVATAPRCQSFRRNRGRDNPCTTQRYAHLSLHVSHLWLASFRHALHHHCRPQACAELVSTCRSAYLTNLICCMIECLARSSSYVVQLGHGKRTEHTEPMHRGL